MSYATAPIVSGPYPALPKIDYELPSGYQQPHVVGGVRPGRYYPAGWNKSLIGPDARANALSWRSIYNEGGYLDGLSGVAEDLEAQAQVQEAMGNPATAAALRQQAQAAKAATSSSDSGATVQALLSAVGDVAKGVGAAAQAYAAQRALATSAGQPVPAPMPNYVPRTAQPSPSMTPLLALGALGLLAWAVLK